LTTCSLGVKQQSSTYLTFLVIESDLQIFC